jgi:hypothetical protein
MDVASQCGGAQGCGSGALPYYAKGKVQRSFGDVIAACASNHDVGFGSLEAVYAGSRQALTPAVVVSAGQDLRLLDCRNLNK